MIIGIRQVPCPQAQLGNAEVEVGVRTCHGIELLRISVGIVPVGLALRIDVDAEGDVAQTLLGDVEAIIHHGREGVGWHIRHLLALVIHEVPAFSSLSILLAVLSILVLIE